MSRAFVREPDDVAPDSPPELRVSAHPNWVTGRGLRMIEERIADLDRQIAACEDEAQLAWLRRDQRYWAARRATAQLVEPPESPEAAAFGTRVTFRRDGKAPESIELVGEDEADPAAGRLSWIAPLARALIGAQPGDVVELANRDPPVELEILAVEPLLRLN
jgi:transcription elongation GreA/GreB family factor